MDFSQDVSDTQQLCDERSLLAAELSEESSPRRLIRADSYGFASDGDLMYRSMPVPSALQPPQPIVSNNNSNNYSSDSSFQFGSYPGDSYLPDLALPLPPKLQLPVRSHHTRSVIKDAASELDHQQIPHQAPALFPFPWRLERTNFALQIDQECEKEAIATAINALEAAFAAAQCDVVKRRWNRCRWSYQYLVGNNWLGIIARIYKFQNTFIVEIQRRDGGAVVFRAIHDRILNHMRDHAEGVKLVGTYQYLHGETLALQPIDVCCCEGSSGDSDGQLGLGQSELCGALAEELRSLLPLAKSPYLETQCDAIKALAGVTATPTCPSSDAAYSTSPGSQTSSLADCTTCESQSDDGHSPCPTIGTCGMSTMSILGELLPEVVRMLREPLPCLNRYAAIAAANVTQDTSVAGACALAATDCTNDLPAALLKAAMVPEELGTRRECLRALLNIAHTPDGLRGLCRKLHGCPRFKDAVPLLEEITGAGDILARERAQQLLNLFEAA
jgi:hypothetical protein